MSTPDEQASRWEARTHAKRYGAIMALCASVVMSSAWGDSGTIPSSVTITPTQFEFSLGSGVANYQVDGVAVDSSSTLSVSPGQELNVDVRFSAAEGIGRVVGGIYLVQLNGSMVDFDNCQYDVSPNGTASGNRRFPVGSGVLSAGAVVEVRFIAATTLYPITGPGECSLVVYDSNLLPTGMVQENNIEAQAILGRVVVTS